MEPPPEPAYSLSAPEEGEVQLPTLSAPAAGSCRFLIALDYDGTLRRHSGGIEPGFFRYMQALRPHGVRWGLNTGRSLRKLADELAAFDTMPDFICTCERYAYLADAAGRLQPAAAHNAHSHGANMALRHRVLPGWLQMLCRLRLEEPGLEWKLAADDPLSIEAADACTLDIIMPRLLPFIGEAATLQRADRFVRLSDSRFHKGSALCCVMQQWHVPEEAIFLMGDGHNDLDAFRCLPRAFRAAPADAHPDIHAWLHRHGGLISPEVGVLHALATWAWAEHLPTP